MLELDVQFHDALNKVYADNEFSDIIDKLGSGAFCGRCS